MDKRPLFKNDRNGQREFNRVLVAAEQQGAKTIFLGDEKQHQAVDAGKAFEVAQKSMTMSELGRGSIRRQTTYNAQKSVEQILDGKYSEAVKGLETKQVSTNQDSVREKYNAIEKPTSKETKEMREEMKEASKADNKLVIKDLAKDYANLSPQQRDKTLVITSTNADRAAINREVRDNLKASGQLGDGKQVEIMSKSGLTKEEMTKAINFEKGQKVEFTKDARSQGFEKGMQGTVTGTDSKTNTVTVKMDDGRKLSFNPEKLEGKELYKASESKEFSKGDKIAFTKNDKDLNVKNGQTGTIEKMEGSKMSVKMENGEKRQFDTKDFKHIDHAYAMTSHKSQGQTFDKVMVHHNTNAGHGDRETYVNVTRAREDVKYYTQDREKAAKQAGEKLDKESATGTGSSKSSSSSEKSSSSSSAKSETKTKESSSAKAMERDGGR